MRVLVIDTVSPEGIAYLEARGFCVDQTSSKAPRDTLYERIADYEAIITRSSTTVTAEFLACARKLRILGRAGVGVDNIDVDACSRQGVVVVNAPYGTVVSAHVPLNDETENMIAAREIAAMKPGVRIVNCARGGIVHEGDLLAALAS